MPVSIATMLGPVPSSQSPLLFRCASDESVMKKVHTRISDSKVSERRPRFIPLASGAGPLTNAQTGIVKAMRIDRRDPLVALREYLSAAETALRQLRRSPNDQTARNTYNFAVGRIIATIRDAKLDPWTQPLRVLGRDGEFVLTHKPDPRPQWNPALYDFHTSGSV
jgi:hypothetical protein